MILPSTIWVPYSSLLALQSYRPSHPDSFPLTTPSPTFNTVGEYPQNLLRRLRRSSKVLFQYHLRADDALYLLDFQAHMFDRSQPLPTVPSLISLIPNCRRNLANGQTRTMKA